jgi:hypothetical protein
MDASEPALRLRGRSANAQPSHAVDDRSSREAHEPRCLGDIPARLAQRLLKRPTLSVAQLLSEVLDDGGGRLARLLEMLGTELRPRQIQSCTNDAVPQAPHVFAAKNDAETLSRLGSDGGPPSGEARIDELQDMFSDCTHVSGSVAQTRYEDLASQARTFRAGFEVRGWEELAGREEGLGLRTRQNPWVTNVERTAGGPSHVILPSTPLESARTVDNEGAVWIAQRSNTPCERLAAHPAVTNHRHRTSHPRHRLSQGPESDHRWIRKSNPIALKRLESEEAVDRDRPQLLRRPAIARRKRSRPLDCLLSPFGRLAQRDLERLERAVMLLKNEGLDEIWRGLREHRVPGKGDFSKERFGRQPAECCRPRQNECKVTSARCFLFNAREERVVPELPNCSRRPRVVRQDKIRRRPLAELITGPQARAPLHLDVI